MVVAFADLRLGGDVAGPESGHGDAPHRQRRACVPLSQQQLADALGLSPVHVSRTLTAFRQEGVLRRLRGWVHLLDPGALEAEGSIVGHLHDEIELVE